VGDHPVHLKLGVNNAQMHDLEVEVAVFEWVMNHVRNPFLCDPWRQSRQLAGGYIFSLFKWDCPHLGKSGNRSG